MIPEQVIHEIDSTDLLERTQIMKREGWRLVQICATTLDAFEMSYSFTIDNRFEHFRLKIPLQQPILPSITEIYFGAFAYENELHDLFGISFQGLKLDYAGNFFKTSVKKPFATSMCVIKKGEAGV
ncbi:MAG TPA: NADH-quinone oxidoreductase subunit C [Kiritimatiellia bacterium]|nr:NADH-quinone oxidoreductase subunit C [Kiritimatiellia bacterium]